MKQLKNERGLTLVELLAVIVILAIIAAIAAVAIGNVISNSKDKAILSDAANVIAGAKIAIMDGACGEPGTSNVVTCKAAEGSKSHPLAPFVESVDLSGVTVTQENSGGEVTYSITYPDFANIKSEKYTPVDLKGKDKGKTPAMEKNILDAMNGKGQVEE